MIPAPNLITSDHLDKNPLENILVYESNLAGTHISDDEVMAKRYGATYSVKSGLSQNTYAIPTRCEKMRPLSLQRIEAEINRFWQVVALHPEKNFLVAQIGLKAGYTEKQIAPFFDFIVAVDNVYLPLTFCDILTPILYAPLHPPSPEPAA